VLVLQLGVAEVGIFLRFIKYSMTPAAGFSLIL